MHSSQSVAGHAVPRSPLSPQSRPRASRASQRLAILGGLLLAACGGSSPSVPGQVGITGEEMPVPGAPGRTFFVDSNFGGKTRSLRISSVRWGRLVDVHDILPGGATNPFPIFRDYVVDPTITGSVDYRLEENPLTRRQQFVIVRERAVAPDEFRALLDAAAAGLSPIVARADDATAAGGFSMMPRNGCIVVQFNDCLQDNAAAVAGLPANVRMFTGDPPETPFFARVLFDPNHGAVINGSFHSTRLLVDMTVSESEMAASPTLAANATGLPASAPGAMEANVSLRFPTRIVQPNVLDPSETQLTRLMSLSGVPLDESFNGPVASNARADVVRAFISGNSQDTSNGFLPDVRPPELMGEWSVTTTAATPVGASLFDFVLDLQFETVCESVLEVGDLLELGVHLLEVTQVSAAPAGGAVSGVVARALSDTGVADPNDLIGTGGMFRSTYDPGLGVPVGCWISFTPDAGTAPVDLVSATANVNVRFTEVMDPATLSALDTLVILAGDGSGAVNATNVVPTTLLSDDGGDRFSFVHNLPFGHSFGMSEMYTVSSLDPVNFPPTDLAGNALVNPVPDVTFTIDDQEPTQETGGIVFRFDPAAQINNNNPALNEIGDPGNGSLPAFPDFAGTVTLDLNRGVLLSRTPTFQSYVIDPSLPQLSPLAGRTLVTGLQEPLSRLGARVQTIWRYHDMGLMVTDPATFNLDVVGLNWMPFGTLVASDFFQRFEIKLGTSAQFPDESLQAGSGLPGFPLSGLFASNTVPFSANYLGGTPANQSVVHSRDRGYTVRPRDRFSSSSMTTMMPFPMNQDLAPGESMRTFTWRDTASELRSDPATLGVPVPQMIEGIAGLLPMGVLPGSVYPAGSALPTVTLPLLMEFNCYPENIGLGSNLFTAVTMQLGPSSLPIFRAISVGGRNADGLTVTKDPDSQVFPTGGFNPSNGMPGPLGDTQMYFGQLDTVIRVNRVVSQWLNTQQLTPVYDAPLVEPRSENQPAGTSVVLDFRSATSFTGTNQARTQNPFDPTTLDPHGDALLSSTGPAFGVNFFNADSSWKRDISQLGGQYLQVRITFINNIETMTSPELAALAFPFQFN